jgi:hypothetical protein
VVSSGVVTGDSVGSAVETVGAVEGSVVGEVATGETAGDEAVGVEVDKGVAASVVTDGVKVGTTVVVGGDEVGVNVAVGGGGKIGSVAVGAGVVGRGVAVGAGRSQANPPSRARPVRPNATNPAPATSRRMARTAGTRERLVAFMRRASSGSTGSRRRP